MLKTSKRSIVEKTETWFLITIPLCLVYSYIFWFLWIVLLSHEFLNLGLGMGGALYPVFFFIPVLIGAAFYEIVAGAILLRFPVSVANRLWITLWIPFLLISILLLVFCPVDGASNYFQALYKSVFR